VGISLAAFSTLFNLVLLSSAPGASTSTFGFVSSAAFAALVVAYNPSSTPSFSSLVVIVIV